MPRRYGRLPGGEIAETSESFGGYGRVEPGAASCDRERTPSFA